MTKPSMKMFAEIARDGRILRVSMVDQSTSPDWVEISPSQVLLAFEDLETRYWENNQIVAKPRTAEVSTYYETLGRFIQGFANTEGTMNGALREFSKVTGPVARAIFSGTRAETAKQYIARILDAENYSQEIKDDLKNVFDQLGLINSARNDIVHYGTQFEEGESFVVTNADRAHLPSRVSTMVVSSEILEQMMADLNKISLTIVVRVMALSDRTAASHFQRALAPILQRPWQYKLKKLVPRG